MCLVYRGKTLVSLQVIGSKVACISSRITTVIQLTVHHLRNHKMAGEIIVLLYVLVLTGCEGRNKTPPFGLLNYSSPHRIDFHTSKN
jgi:hypothetical protein